MLALVLKSWPQTLLARRVVACLWLSLCLSLMLSLSGVGHNLRAVSETTHAREMHVLMNYFLWVCKTRFLFHAQASMKNNLPSNA